MNSWGDRVRWSSARAGCLGGQVEQGFLVLADISGFTAFVTDTELEHGAQIIAVLLEVVIRHLPPPLEVQEVEGDAVFALGPDRSSLSPVILLDGFADTFVAFKTRQREMQAMETCPCNACRKASRLNLKIVAHHGAFLRQIVGGRNRVAGPDVILVHRLLKNGLGRADAYVLLTEAAVQSMGVDPIEAGLQSHTESYEHLGTVRCFVGDFETVSTGRSPAVTSLSGR